MKTKKEFKEYLAAEVGKYLPEDFNVAAIAFHDVVKHNDQKLTAMSIVKAGTPLSPVIYIEPFFQEYMDGKEIDEVVKEIAELRIKFDAPVGFTPEEVTGIFDYENVREKLQVRLCAADQNQELMEALVYTEHGDFIATYHICLESGEDGCASTPVTKELMEYWGISMEELHTDALKADLKDSSRKPIFSDMQNVVDSMMCGSELVNLFETPESVPLEMGLFCLTNSSKQNGAGLILQKQLMHQISEIVGGSFFILPSSKHEVLVIPAGNAKDHVEDLFQMVKEVNETSVEREDYLSDEVQYYNAETEEIGNARRMAA